MRSLRNIPDPNAGAIIDPYELRALGDKASRAHLERKTPLTDAVVEVVRSAGQKLNNHHIQRIVEFANLKTFRDLRQPVLSTTSRPVEFEGGPASAIEVIRRLGSTGTEGTMSPAPKGPTSDLVSSAQDLREDKQTKTASLTRGEVINAVDLFVKMGQAADECHLQSAVLQEKIATVLHDINRNAALAMSSGASAGDVLRVLASGTVGSEEPAVAMKLAEDAIRANVFPRFGLIGEAEEESLEKVSSARPNPNCSLFQKAAELGVLLHELGVAQKAEQVLVSERRKLTSSLHY